MSPVKGTATSATPSATCPGSGGRLVATDGRTLPLRGVSIRAEARAGLARAALHQRFVNTYAEPLRVTYLVPLPADAALAGYAFRLGDRRIVGEIDRIAAARERFETALLEGRSAGLVEQERTNLFTLELGNVPSGVEVVAELTIDQPLRWLDEGAWEWRFPTVVAPRYLGGEGRVSDAERVSVDVTESRVTIDTDVTLLIRDALTEGGPPVSPSHPLAVAPRASGHEARLRGALDRDIVIRWPARGTAPGLTLDIARPASDRPHAVAAYGVLTVTPPSPENRPSAARRDLIVLIDTSGSMAGEPLAQAKTLVCALVESLGEADQLELIAFASRPLHWRPQAAPATEAARRHAIRWLGTLAAGGSTEMRDAVTEALRPLRKEGQRQVVLVTDGLIGFENEIVATLTHDLPRGSRLHTVGVGSSVNRALTAPAARAGRGTEVVIGLGEDVGPHVARLLARMLEPVLTEIKISGSALLDHAPRALPDVYAAAPLRVALRLQPTGGDLHVHGFTRAGTWDGDLIVEAVAAGEGNPAVVALYGREAVEDLELAHAAGLGVSDQDVERIGLDFQIATRLTSWVAVSEEPAVDPRQPVRRERIPHALPDGMSVEGLGLRATSPKSLSQRLGLARPSAGANSFSDLAPGTWAGLYIRGAFTGAATYEWDAAARRLAGRLVVRTGRELTFEIEVDAELDWAPDDAKVLWWPSGIIVPAEIVAERTTARGRVTSGLVVRLGVRLTADGPAKIPECVAVRSRTGLLAVIIRA